MKDNIREAMKRYIDARAGELLWDVPEAQDLTRLDERVYALLEQRKAPAAWRLRRMGALAAAFVLLLCLGMAGAWLGGRGPAHTRQDVYYTVVISYEDRQYGYYSNRAVIDGYGLAGMEALTQDPAGFTESLTDGDILYVDSVMDRNSFQGAGIFPYSEDVIILRSGGQFYYLEKIVMED